MGFADFALATLYILGYQVSSILVGVALGLGKLTIAASQFIFGWISDYKYTRWGRRKPYLIVLSPILGISFIFLLLPGLLLDLSNPFTLFIWLIFWYQIFNFSYGITSPYQSWMVEQFDLNSRPMTSQYQNTIGFFGTAVTTIFSFIVLPNFSDKIEANPGVIPPEFLYSVIIFGIIVIILFYVTTFIMPTESYHKIESSSVERLKAILRNKNYLLVTGMVGLASIAWVMVGSLILLFIEKVLQFESIFYYIIAGIFLIGILLFLYLWRKLIINLGKKRTLLYIFLFAIITLPFSLLGLVPMNNLSFIYGLIFVSALTGCLGGWFLLPNILYADIAEDDQIKTGELKAGTYQGFPSIILNLFQSIGLILMGFILELPEVSIKSSNISIGYVLWGPICALILVGVYFYSKKFLLLDFTWENNRNS